MVGKSVVIDFLRLIICMFVIDLGEDRSAILVVGKEGRGSNILWACTMYQMASKVFS